MEKVNFQNSPFQFESHSISEVKFAQTHTAGFFANIHLKPELRTNNGDNLENISSDSWIGDSIHWSNNEQGRIDHYVRLKIFRT